MNLHILTIAQQRPVVGASTAWQRARDDAVHAYRAWVDAPPTRRRHAYAVYVAAADREAAAADRLAVCTR